MPTVLITGAGRGLGFEFARQYASAGWRVLGTVRDSAAAKKLTALGANAEAHIAEVTDRRSLAAVAARLQGEPIDVLICNSGIRGRPEVAFGEEDYAQWEEILRVNLLGAAAVVEAFVDNVAASRQKVIAMMSSRLGSIAESSAREIAYASSKAALNAVMKAFSRQLAPLGITVVSLSPGWVRTDMGGTAAPLAPEDSVSGLRKVIAGLTPGQSGKFLTHQGEEVPW
jgi:NAD(P)-dependent dehydrogenase (short-subunit alcohol dehydrogenase family)